ncbi:carbon-nitrogen hydrolase family protein [Actinomadura spongiicola]|uniref:Carbon-nitrogen hydrolase family protein n=1 Tax=Actinomadura spongiicola TaxID=2303421 RepID=A0A372GG55_9ACTN|nr:carbon-nitrogen hydrolase family protein [Actinomadura spongiicola]RFS84348.1 carbon-nitrogen hydrolase family protein [Actinomadura spongiicola]
MPAPLSLAAVQPPCVPRHVEANVAAHVGTIRAAQARVVVFPELSVSGYQLDAEAVEPSDPRLSPLVGACAESGTVALVGAPVGEHIAMLRVDGDGVAVAYRKMWLSDREAERFEPGPGPAVVTVDGWRFGLAICKDTGVPRHLADTAALGIDVYLAGVCDTDPAVPEERAHRAATGHGVWAAFASFAGRAGDGYDPAAGHSSIRTPDGLVVAQAGPEPGDLARATLV